jgi:ABC-2 type transport system permease protein
MRREKNTVLLALGQVRYQLLLLVRSPLGFFLTLVVPVLLFVCLNLLTPDTVAATPGGLRYVQFLTPAIATFCVLNACYVNTITGIVLAREEGVLKRLRGTPLPIWTYLAGRFGAALVTAVVGVTVIVAMAVAFFDVTIVWRTFASLLALLGLGIVTFFLLAVAVVTLVPKSESALPVAYGTVLPLAFISDVFFSSIHAPRWLHDLASAFPVAPIARALEATFDPSSQTWPLPTSGLLTIAGWSVAAVLVIAFTFRWEPGPMRWRRRRAAAPPEPVPPVAGPAR